MGVADDQLQRAAADIEDEAVLLAQVDGVADRQINESRLFLRTDDVQFEARLAADPLDKVAAVRRLAHRAARDRADVADALESGHLEETRQGRDAVVHGAGGEDVLAEAAAAEMDHGLVAAQGAEVAVGRDLGHDEVNAVGADVDRADLGGRRRAEGAGPPTEEVELIRGLGFTRVGRLRGAHGTMRVVDCCMGRRIGGAVETAPAGGRGIGTLL
jgi:hypothetical protein